MFLSRPPALCIVVKRGRSAAASSVDIKRIFQLFNRDLSSDQCPGDVTLGEEKKTNETVSDVSVNKNNKNFMYDNFDLMRRGLPSFNIYVPQFHSLR